MTEQIMELIMFLMYLFEGYCIQYFFCRFAEPRLSGIKAARWAAGIVWIGTRMLGTALFPDMDGIILVEKLLLNISVLFVFCLGWYRGNLLLKIFLVVQFISLRELAFWAGYSLIYIGNKIIDLLTYGALKGAVPMEYLSAATGVLLCFFMILVEALQGAFLFISIRAIVRSYGDKEKGRMDKEAVFYLLPAVAGVLVAVLVRLLMITVTGGVPVLLYERYPVLHLIIPLTALVLLGAIVFSFRLYQNMTALQKERAEKVILENQILQMQGSIVEMEHLYDRMRSVRHDMRNHMAVLQKLIQKKCQTDFGEDQEIRHYFENMCGAVEQLETRVRTGNAVSDAVVESKFRYAEKRIEGVRLDAGDFMLADTASIKAYDMGIILSNGLDNAIEACIRMREKRPDSETYIVIRSFKARSMFFIEIENSFDGQILFNRDGGLPLSTKEDKEMHGIGLKNIRKCAVKYGGDMDCIVKDNRFILSVMVKG